MSLKVDHERCTECRMCYIVCRELDINAVYVALEPLHRIEIDLDACTYPGCTACLMYCPAAGSMVEEASYASDPRRILRQMGVADDARRTRRRVPPQTDPREMPAGLGGDPRTHRA